MGHGHKGSSLHFSSIDPLLQHCNQCQVTRTAYFCHFEFHSINTRTQIHVRELHNIVIHPQHGNLMEFKAMDIASIEIGSLSYDSDCAQKGALHDSLKGDILFLAAWMGLLQRNTNISNELTFNLCGGWHEFDLTKHLL